MLKLVSQPFLGNAAGEKVFQSRLVSAGVATLFFLNEKYAFLYFLPYFHLNSSKE
jgi:hypothetical protein